MFVAEYFWNLCVCILSLFIVATSTKRTYRHKSYLYYVYCIQSIFRWENYNNKKKVFSKSHLFHIYRKRVHCSAPQHQILKVLFSVEKRKITNIQSKYSICVVYMNYLFKFSQVKHFLFTFYIIAWKHPCVFDMRK